MPALSVRFNLNEIDCIDRMCHKSGKRRADIVREGLTHRYDPDRVLPRRAHHLVSVTISKEHYRDIRVFAAKRNVTMSEYCRNKVVSHLH